MVKSGRILLEFCGPEQKNLLYPTMLFGDKTGLRSTKHHREWLLPSQQAPVQNRRAHAAAGIHALHIAECAHVHSSPCTTTGCPTSLSPDAPPPPDLSPFPRRPAHGWQHEIMHCNPCTKPCNLRPPLVRSLREHGHGYETAQPCLDAHASHKHTALQSFSQLTGGALGFGAWLAGGSLGLGLGLGCAFLAAELST